MFNLEKFQADFKTKKISEFHFYTALVKESAKMPSPISVEQISISHTEIDSFPVPRFVNLTGEKENFNCTLLIDTETGFLYAPHWFNINNRTFETIAENEAFAAERVIGGFKGWALCDPFVLENFPINERIKWFDSKAKNKNNNGGRYNGIYWSRSCLNSKKSFSFPNGILIWGKASDDEILKEGTLYSYDKLDTAFPNWKKEKTIKKGEEYPFVYSKCFADLGIWGNQFTTSKFIKFVVENNFDTSFLPQEPNLIPFVLTNLQNKTGIQLHGDTIIFPADFFNPLSEVSKHQNAINYLDFLLWKIENYTNSHHEQVQNANTLYSQLSNLKTDNPLLVPIQQYLLQKFDFSLQNLEVKLLAFKAESIAFLEKIEAQNSLCDFSENTPRLDFNLLGETVTRLYNQQIEKVGRFASEVNFLLQLLEKITAVFKASRDFITAQKTALRLDCGKEYVEDQFDTLFSEWQTEINALETQYLPLIQAYFFGTLSQEVTLRLLTLLGAYRALVNNFFLTERIPLIQKYHANPKSDFLQKLETQQALLIAGGKTVEAINKVIHTNPQHLTKKFLHNQAQALLLPRFTELTAFSQQANLALTLQTQLSELQQRNFEIHLADVEQYGKELQQRNTEITSLMFKMQKDLERQSNAKNITGESE